MAEQLTRLELNNLNHYNIEELVRRFRDSSDPLISLFCVTFDKEIDNAIERATETDTEIEMELDEAKTELMEKDDLIAELEKKVNALNDENDDLQSRIDAHEKAQEGATRPWWRRLLIQAGLKVKGQR